MNRRAQFVRIYSLRHCFSGKYETSLTRQDKDSGQPIICLFIYFTFITDYGGTVQLPYPQQHTSICVFLNISRGRIKQIESIVRWKWMMNNVRWRRRRYGSIPSLDTLNSDRRRCNGKMPTNQCPSKCSGWVMRMNLIALYQHWWALLVRIRNAQTECMEKSRKLAVSLDNNMSFVTLPL